MAKPIADPAEKAETSASKMTDMDTMALFCHWSVLDENAVTSRLGDGGVSSE